MLTKLQLRVFVASGVLLASLAGCATEGDLEEGVTEDEVLAPPTSVTVTPTSVDRATVSWTAVPGAVKYYIYQQTGTTGPLVQINSALAPATSLPVAHLSAGTQYCFSVRTVDSTDTAGAFSTSSCGTTQTAPGAPGTIVVEQTSASQITVRWTAVANAQKYYVYHSAALTGTYSFLGTTLAPGTSFLQSNVPTGTHCYKVQTQAATGTSPLSGAICNDSPQPPTNVQVVRTAAGRLQITWTPAAGANRTYTYESRAGATLIFAGSTLIGSPQVVNRANLTVGVEYCYQLQTQFDPASSTTARSGLTIPVCGVP